MTAGTLSFYSYVSAQNYSDRVYVYVNGEYKMTISSSGWHQYDIAIEHGVNDIEWIYSKDRSGTSGDDAAYIDNITFNAN